MREYICRGKRKDNGEWIVGTPIIYEDGRTRIIESHTDIFCYVKDSSIIQTVAHEVDPETVGQWTGLHDSTKWDDLTEEEREDFTIAGNFPSEWKGKKIFEGDIVHCIARMDEANCIIIFEEGEFRLIPERRYKTYVTGGGYHAIHCFEKAVIGNIHDNPELLQMEG